jgi:hypothetical protein
LFLLSFFILFVFILDPIRASNLSRRLQKSIKRPVYFFFSSS